ncbi:MAG: hypothetical protein APF81_21925 [Desulfosporosinus sp. BRH_c37]|nr:MAG: hypothetical protein APF81_21925 [Desulfosporosinus sp. BRH_c37]
MEKRNTLIFLDSQYILDEVKEFPEFYKILIIDKNSNIHSSQINYENCFDSIKEVDNILSENNVIELVDLILKEENIQIKSILATFENVVEIAGILRERFNIKTGIGRIQTEILRNKFLMKNKIKQNDLLCAECSKVYSENNLSEFATNYGFPLVLKPINGAGSNNTYIIHNQMDIIKYAALMRSDSNTTWIAESFIEGEEYHCDSVVVEGKILLTSIGKYHNNQINTVISGKMDGTIVFPSSDKGIINEKIKLFNQQVIRALQIENSICHLEVFVTQKTDIYFGEIGIRVPGGYIGKCINNTHKINIYHTFIRVEIGEKEIEFSQGSNKYTGVVAFPSKKGEIVEISSEEDFKKVPGLVELSIFNKKGDFISERTSTRERTGYLIAESESLVELKATLERVYGLYRLETR